MAKNVMIEIAEKLGKIEGTSKEGFKNIYKKLDAIDQKLKSQNGSIAEIKKKQSQRDSICKSHEIDIKYLKDGKLTWSKVAMFAVIFGTVTGTMIEIITFVAQII